MPIPESDHQLIANLIAFVSLIIATVIIIYSLLEMKKAKQIAMQANYLANKANQLMEEVVHRSKSEQKTQNLPDISMRFQVSKISRISAEFDIITLNFINESLHKIILENVHILPPFKAQLNSPSALDYREEVKVRIHIDETISSTLNNLKRSNSSDIEAMRQNVEEALIQSVLTVQVMNELHVHYEIDFNYNSSSDQFEGTPIQLRYRSLN